MQAEISNNNLSYQLYPVRSNLPELEGEDHGDVHHQEGDGEEEAHWGG